MGSDWIWPTAMYLLMVAIAFLRFSLLTFVWEAHLALLWLSLISIESSQVPPVPCPLSATLSSLLILVSTPPHTSALCLSVSFCLCHWFFWLFVSMTAWALWLRCLSQVSLTVWEESHYTGLHPSENDVLVATEMFFFSIVVETYKS